MLFSRVLLNPRNCESEHCKSEKIFVFLFRVRTDRHLLSLPSRSCRGGRISIDQLTGLDILTGSIVLYKVLSERVFKRTRDNICMYICIYVSQIIMLYDTQILLYHALLARLLGRTHTSYIALLLLRSIHFPYSSLLFVSTRFSVN